MLYVKTLQRQESEHIHIATGQQVESIWRMHIHRFYVTFGTSQTQGIHVYSLQANYDIPVPKKVSLILHFFFNLLGFPVGSAIYLLSDLD